MKNLDEDPRIALRQELVETLPRIAYRGDGSVPQLVAIEPRHNTNTGDLAYLLMDAMELKDATYVVALEPGGNGRKLLAAAVSKFHAEWN